jgi:hypothetical protein
LIDCDESVEAALDPGEQLAVGHAGHARLLHRENRMADQLRSETPGQAFVDNNAHGSGNGSELRAGFLQELDDLRAADTGEIVEKYVDGVAGLQAVREVFYRHARARENRNTTEDIGIGRDEPCVHGAKLGTRRAARQQNLL